MTQEDDTYVIHGPLPAQPILEVSLGKLAYDNLLANVGKPEALIDVETGNYISFEQVLHKTCRLAESLRRAGYGKDTIVSICSENNLQFYIPVISCLYIGAMVAPINHIYTDDEIVHCMNITKPRVVFCSKAVSRKLVHLKNTRLQYIEKIIILDSDIAIFGTETLDSFIEINLKGYFTPGRLALEEFDASKQIAFIMCSSGTTGLPKGVMQTHRNVMVRYMHSLNPLCVLQTDSFMAFLPFYHGFGLLTTLMAIFLGQKVIVFRKFEEDLFLKTIQNYKIEMLYLTPVLVVMLAKSSLVPKYDLSSIKDILCAAAPLGKDIEETVKRRLKISTMRQGYGLTECTLGVLTMDIGVAKHGSSGKVMPYLSCKIRDPETGCSLGPGKVGELCVKGPMVMAGYYGNEKATKDSYTSDGWLLTGDLCYYDKEGFFYVVDRLKELIKYKGFQVAPAELEAILLTHPKIQDAGVVGIPNEETDELPLAFVVKRENANLNEKEVTDFVAGKVSSHKRLRGGVIFVPSIPKNPSGKILRRELRKMLNKTKSKL